jgi:hypothetical protein
MKGAQTMTEIERHAGRLWRGQPRDTGAPSIESIRSRADRFERTVRRWNIVGAVVFVLVIAAEAWQIWVHPDLLERVGDLLTVAALIVVMVRFRPHAARLSMPAGLGLTSSVDFYRSQLARQRDLASHPWRYLVLFVPGVGLSLFGDALDRPAGQTVAIAIVAVVLFLAVAWVHARTVRRLQREIDVLG